MGVYIKGLKLVKSWERKSGIRIMGNEYLRHKIIEVRPTKTKYKQKKQL